MTYQTWVEFHAKIFSLTGEAIVATMAEWARLFEDARITPEELADASSWLLLHLPTGTYPNAHPGLLYRKIMEQRAADYDSSRKDTLPTDQGTCMDCNNSGFVADVQHPCYLDATHHVGTTVLCHCPLGLWYAGRSEIMTLRQYSALAPDWRERKRRHLETQTHLNYVADQGRENSHIGIAMDAVLARLKERIGK